MADLNSLAIPAGRKSSIASRISDQSECARHELNINDLQISHCSLCYSGNLERAAN